VKEQIESLGAEFISFEFKEEDGAGQGGYAKQMSPQYYAAQKECLSNVLKGVDLVITTALIPGQKAPVLIDENMVHLMKPMSVIVDMAAEMGGNCELTR
jgi:H+-translocating NAD(P) transhydrogenase subunit alpha